MFRMLGFFVILILLMNASKWVADNTPEWFTVIITILFFATILYGVLRFIKYIYFQIISSKG